MDTIHIATFGGQASGKTTWLAEAILRGQERALVQDGDGFRFVLIDEERPPNPDPAIVRILYSLSKEQSLAGFKIPQLDKRHKNQLWQWAIDQTKARIPPVLEAMGDAIRPTFGPRTAEPYVLLFRLKQGQRDVGYLLLSDYPGGFIDDKNTVVMTMARRTHGVVYLVDPDDMTDVSDEIALRRKGLIGNYADQCRAAISNKPFLILLSKVDAHEDNAVAHCLSRIQKLVPPTANLHVLPLSILGKRNRVVPIRLDTGEIVMTIPPLHQRTPINVLESCDWVIRRTLQRKRESLHTFLAPLYLLVCAGILVGAILLANAIVNAFPRGSTPPEASAPVVASVTPRAEVERKPTVDYPGPRAIAPTVGGSSISASQGPSWVEEHRTVLLWGVFSMLAIGVIALLVWWIVNDWLPNLRYWLWGN